MEEKKSRFGWAKTTLGLIIIVLVAIALVLVVAAATGHKISLSGAFGPIQVALVPESGATVSIIDIPPTPNVEGTQAAQPLAIAATPTIVPEVGGPIDNVILDSLGEQCETDQYTVQLEWIDTWYYIGSNGYQMYYGYDFLYYIYNPAEDMTYWYDDPLSLGYSYNEWVPLGFNIEVCRDIVGSIFARVV